MYFNKLKHLELSSELINNDEGFTKFNIERLEWLVSPSEVISDDIKQLLTILHKHLVSYIKERRESISIIPESLNDDKHLYKMYNEIFECIVNKSTNSNDYQITRDICNQILSKMIFLEHHKIKFSLVNAIHNFKKQQIEKLIKNNTFLGAISGHRKYINCLEFLTTSLYLPSLFFSRTIGTYALTLNIVAILGAETWAAKSWKGNQDDIDKLYHELYESDLLKGTLEDYDKQLPYLGVHEFKSSVRNMFWYSLNKTSDCLKHIRESVNEYNKPAY